MNDDAKRRQWADYLESVLRDVARTQVDALKAGQQKSPGLLNQSNVVEINRSTDEIDQRAAECADKLAIRDADLMRMLFAERNAALRDIGDAVRSNHASVRNADNASGPRAGGNELRDRINGMGRSLVKTHHSHEIVGVIAQRLSVSKPHIRNVLNESGIKTKKEKPNGR